MMLHIGRIDIVEMARTSLFLLLIILVFVDGTTVIEPSTSFLDLNEAHPISLSQTQNVIADSGNQFMTESHYSQNVPESTLPVASANVHSFPTTDMGDIIDVASSSEAFDDFQSLDNNEILSTESLPVLSSRFQPQLTVVSMHSTTSSIYTSRSFNADRSDTSSSTVEIFLPSGVFDEADQTVPGSETTTISSNLITVVSTSTISSDLRQTKLTSVTGFQLRSDTDMPISDFENLSSTLRSTSGSFHSFYSESVIIEHNTFTNFDHTMETEQSTTVMPVSDTTRSPSQASASSSTCENNKMPFISTNTTLQLYNGTTENIDVVRLKTMTESVVLTFDLMFDGDCQTLLTDQVLLFAFSGQLLKHISMSFNMSTTGVQISPVTCEPMSVSVTLSQVPPEWSSFKMQDLLLNKTIRIENVEQILNYSVIGLSIHEKEVANPLIWFLQDLGTAELVIILVASFLFAMLCILGIIFLCKACYIKSRGDSFRLKDVPRVSFKMSDFSLIRIPRPRMVYKSDTALASKHQDDSFYNNNDPACAVQGTNINNYEETSVNGETLRVHRIRHKSGLLVGVTSYGQEKMFKDDVGNKSSRELLCGDNNDVVEGAVNPAFQTEDNGDKVPNDTKVEIELTI